MLLFWNIENLRNQISLYRLDEIEEFITRLARPAIYMSRIKTDDSQISIGESKFGGIPDLPDDVVWPYRKGTPLTFIAQFELSQISAKMPTLPDNTLQQTTLWDMDSITTTRPDEVMYRLPETGTLFFFYDAVNHSYGEVGSWKIIYSQSGVELSPRKNHHADPSEAIEFQILPTHQIQFNSCLSLPMPYEMSSFQRKPFYLDLEERYWNMLFNNCLNPTHQIYGYPRMIQNPLQYECVIDTQDLNRVRKDGKIEFHRSDGELVNIEFEMMKWQFLFQIDTDESLNVIWGDMGTLYVCIPTANLISHNFDASHTIMQCS